MQIETFELTPFSVNCYVVKDGQAALVIDPGEAAPELLMALEGYTVTMIVNTHGHCDHCGGNRALIEKTGAPLACHAEARGLLETIAEQGRLFGVPFPSSPAPDRLLKEGDVLAVGETSLVVRHAPGHAPGHIVLIGDGLVFSGDVLFAGSIGRTDLFGGDYQQLMESILTTLLSLPDETVVYPGHGPTTTIGAERNTNPFLHGLHL